MAMAEALMLRWDTADVAVDEPDKNYTAKTFTGEDGIPVVLIKYRCDGVT